MYVKSSEELKAWDAEFIKGRLDLHVVFDISLAAKFLTVMELECDQMAKAAVDLYKRPREVVVPDIVPSREFIYEPSPSYDMDCPFYALNNQSAFC